MLIDLTKKPQALGPVADNTKVALPPNQPPAATAVKPADKCQPGGAQTQQGAKQLPPPTQPGIYSVKTDAIPTSMKTLDHWVTWVEQPNEKGKPTKVPYIAGTQKKVAIDNPSSWRSFNYAVNTLGEGGRGLGFVLPPSGAMFFLDLDHARNPQTGDIKPWAVRLIECLDSYTEISPSGSGLHILGFVTVAVPPAGLKKTAIELYTRGRYSTITGYRHPYAPKEPNEVDISWLYRLIRAGVFTFTEGDKYSWLFNSVFGGWKTLGYASHSEADMGLCRFLALRLDNDFADIDAAFRLSGLMRKKWDEKRVDSTYGRDTILKVLNEPKTTTKYKATEAPLAIADASLHEGTASYRNTDSGNAERLVARHGNDLRYLFASNQWYVWDGKRYAVADPGAIERKAKDTATAIYEEAAKAPKEHRRSLEKWATNSHSRARLSSMVCLARSEPGISVTSEELDANPWLLNGVNGTIDLNTSKLREHRREDLITQLAPVVFDPDAQCPVWDKFLLRIMDDNAGLISFLQRAVGYSLTGSVKEGVMFLQYGSGRNGKTVFSETINHLAGDYARTADASLLLTRKSDGPRHDIARLRRARLVWTSETAEGGRFDEAQVKLLTGGDKIAVRNLYEALEEFYYKGKMWLRTNKKPEIHGRDVAIWSRIWLIPFLVTIPDDEQDKELGLKLRAELPGILAWAVRGCLDWQKDGLCPPPEVLAATKEYEQESDALKDFLEDYCNLGKGLEVVYANLYMAARSYCAANGLDIWSSNYFSKQLTERGFKRGKINGERSRIGLNLKSEAVPGPIKTPWTATGPTAGTAALPDIDEFSSKL
jgi:putative DNA primase/helicase